MTCRHPYCDADAVYRGLFCGTSCRVSYHNNHKARLEALEGWLVYRTTQPEKLGEVSITVTTSTWLGAEDSIREAARQLYRVAHGYVAKKGDLPTPTFDAGPKVKQADLPLAAYIVTPTKQPLDNLSPISGYQCGKCKRSGFTKAGLARHKCKQA